MKVDFHKQSFTTTFAPEFVAELDALARECGAMKNELLIEAVRLYKRHLQQQKLAESYRNLPEPR
jgi:hypothetical protein